MDYPEPAGNLRGRFPADFEKKNHTNKKFGNRAETCRKPAAEVSGRFPDNPSLTDHTVHRFYPQNGICIQKYNFWPKNDGEKWSSKIYFEIPPCGKMVIFCIEFEILRKTPK